MIVGCVESFVLPAYTCQLAPVPRVPVIVNITDPGAQTLVTLAVSVGVEERVFTVSFAPELVTGLPPPVEVI